MMDQGFVQRFSSRAVLCAALGALTQNHSNSDPSLCWMLLPKKSITMGEERSVEEIINEVLKDRDFYEESGGGLTLSGWAAGNPTQLTYYRDGSGAPYRLNINLFNSL